MKKVYLLSTLVLIILTSCVPKKKYIVLEDYLTKTQAEKENLETKFSKIEARIATYNEKISSLKEANDSHLSSLNEVAVMSNATKKKMRTTLSKVDPSLLANAATLEDSINLAISYNLKKSIADEEDDINISIDQTVVMINIAEKLLFDSGSYNVNDKAYDFLKKLADVINSEPSLEIMVEGHTDSSAINSELFQDNWDLSVKRATSIVRILQKKYNVDPSKMIAAGRSSYIPLVENDSKENRSKNRRTRIVIIPNLDKFFALLDSEEL